MAAECQTCAAVAAGGRIRLTEESADLLDALIRSARRDSLRVRRNAINRMAIVGEERDLAELQEANAQIRLMDFVREEIGRVRDEKGWRNGQPERPHS